MKIGIIGTGWGARVQVPAFRSAGHEVVSIAGHDAEKTKKIAAELGVAPAASWRELIARDLDLVTIVTPPATHREIAIAALERELHVISEKPTAMNAAEAEEMLRVANKRPTQLSLIDHELRFLPAWREARQRIDKIGPLRFFELRYSSPSRGDRSRGWNWWSDAAMGGGVLGAIGSHAVDSVRYFCGEVTEVQAVLHTFVEERPYGDGATRPVTSDDFAALHLRLASGALAVVHCSVVSGFDEPTTITIHGEQGGLRLVRNELSITHGGKLIPVEVHDDVAASIPGNSDGGFFGSGTVHLGRALAAADRQGLTPAATFADGLAQQRILDAARASHAEGGRWVSC